MSYGDRSRKAQMRQANASGALYAVIIGGEELATGVVSVKNMHAEGEEPVRVRREELVTFLAASEA
jgi:histidyl-tRNA synthetase